MLNIKIKTIPHKDQRYNTVGDYVGSANTETISISDLNNWKYEILVATHELVESVLCKSRGITNKSITDFDEKFNQGRRTEENVAEPGLSNNAPYHNEHMFATMMEKKLAEELDINWDEYNKHIDHLYKESIKDDLFDKN